MKFFNTLYCSFVVDGEPVPKLRHRTTKGGHSYTPQKTATYEEIIKQEALLTYSCIMGFGVAIPCRVEIKIYRAIPKSFSKKRAESAEAGGIFPTSKPDVDNYAKLILDALNGIIYKDDSQVVQLSVEKWYSYNPRAEVNIYI